MDRQRRLRGLGQAVEVGQDRSAAVAQLKIELTAGAELEQVQAGPPPGEKAREVSAGVRVARVGEAIEPGVEVGKEMAGGLDQGLAGDHGRPAFRRRCRACVRTTARLS